MNETLPAGIKKQPQIEQISIAHSEKILAHDAPWKATGHLGYEDGEIAPPLHEASHGPPQARDSASTVSAHSSTLAQAAAADRSCATTSLICEM